MPSARKAKRGHTQGAHKVVRVKNGRLFKEVRTLVVSLRNVGVESSNLFFSTNLMERRIWYVLHVKPRTEKVVNDHLATLRVFHYLPLVRKETKVQRRKVVRHVPVFPGYVFTRLFPEERMVILRTQHIVRTIEVTDPRRMIHQLRQIEHASRLPADLRAVESFAAGEYVRVVSGPLRGLEGQVKRLGAQTSLVLTVDILGRALEASVSPGDLEKIAR